MKFNIVAFLFTIIASLACLQLTVADALPEALPIAEPLAEALAGPLAEPTADADPSAEAFWPGLILKGLGALGSLGK
uniref:Vespid chemotactic peptide n=1 Tax=Parapolybia varia TaxID=91407 RepID=A0A3S6I2W2_9HYME|nr:Vespid chemotactic peptide [Parapolybia varia]